MRSTLLPSTVSQAPPFTMSPHSPTANTRPAQRDYVGRVHAAPVIEAEIPVGALHSRTRRPRTPEGDSHNPRNLSQACGQMLHSRSIPQVTGLIRRSPNTSAWALREDHHLLDAERRIRS